MIRWAKLIINGIEIKHEEQDGLYFEIDYSSGKSQEIGVATIKIYNLVQDVKVNSVIDFYFGRDDVGGYFGTFIVKKKSKYIKNSDVIQEFLCSERAIETSNIIAVSLRGKVKSKQIIEEICKEAKLNLIQNDLKIEKEYPNSFSCFGRAIDQLKKEIKNTSSKLKVEGKNIYVYNDTVISEMIDLNYNTGLLKEPRPEEMVKGDKETEEMAQNNEVNTEYSVEDMEKNELTKEYDYNVECLSYHLLKKGNYVNLSGNKTFNGLAIIEEVEMKNSDKWVTELKVKVI